MHSASQYLIPGQHLPTPGYSDSGTPGAPVVVMLHSSMASRRQWRGLAAQLERRFRVIAIDLHGYGERLGALPEASSFGLWSEVELIEQILAVLLPPKQPYHVVGHSYGAAVALRLALCPRVRSLALYEPTAFHLLAVDDPALAPVRAVSRDISLAVDDAETAAAVCGFIDFWSGPGSYAQLDPQRRHHLHRLADKVALDFQALFGDPLSVSDLRHLDMPLCLLTGSASPACVHAVADALTQARPDIERHRFATGHMAPITDAGLINPVLTGFLARQAERQAASRQGLLREYRGCPSMANSHI